MPDTMGSWISHEVSEFLARVSSYPDEASALQGGIERVGEGLEAEIVSVVRSSDIILSIGLCRDDRAQGILRAAVDAGEASVTLESLGPCKIAVADLEDGAGTHLIVARAGEDPFGRDEQVLLDNMGRTLGLVLRMLRTLDGERATLEHLRERQLMLERLVQVQRSISHRAPLQEVLDAITEGAKDLMGDEIAALRLVDPEDPRFLLMASASGVDPDMFEKLRRIPVDQGAGGRAFQERRLWLIESYADAPEAIPEFSKDSLQSAMAVPVSVEGAVVGSLVTGTYRADRAYSETEQEMLQALADNASIALTDAKTVESMREAQRTKDMFLAMVSHELKTPLTVIMGSLHTLRNRLSQLPEDLREDLLVSSLRRGEDLQRLIDMLLKGARADLAGAREEVFLPRLIQDAVRGFEVGRQLRVAHPPEATFYADATAVHQILGVLLENAVAHSPLESEIHVESKTTATKVTIRVRNEGSLPDGIDVEELFSPFQRGAEARSSGVGLGLHIAKSLAQSIEGHIDASSGDGMVDFTLVFPAEVKARQARGTVARLTPS